MAIKLRGGGGKASVARPLVDEPFFLQLPLVILRIYVYLLISSTLRGCERILKQARNPGKAASPIRGKNLTALYDKPVSQTTTARK